MAFHEVRFPDDIDFGSSGGPEYSTDIIELASGFEQRNVNWSEARARYDAAPGIKTQVQLDEIIAFFRARKGGGHSFRFKDWTDYSVTGQVIGTGNGTTTIFQLLKTYTNGGITENRTIKKPVSGTIKIYKDAVLQSSGYTASTTTGVITFTTAPANGVIIAADFEFDVPVRFDTDRIEASTVEAGVVRVRNLPLIEVRV